MKSVGGIKRGNGWTPKETPKIPTSTISPEPEFELRTAAKLSQRTSDWAAKIAIKQYWHYFNFDQNLKNWIKWRCVACSVTEKHNFYTNFNSTIVFCFDCVISLLTDVWTGVFIGVKSRYNTNYEQLFNTRMIPWRNTLEKSKIISHHISQSW